jgi:hypothetical protein
MIYFLPGSSSAPRGNLVAEHPYSIPSLMECNYFPPINFLTFRRKAAGQHKPTCLHTKTRSVLCPAGGETFPMKNKPTAQLCASAICQSCDHLLTRNGTGGVTCSNEKCENSRTWFKDPTVFELVPLFSRSHLPENADGTTEVPH